MNSADRLVFVMVQTSHPGNIGAAARAIKTMGLHRLRLVAPREFPAPAARVMASGADDVLDGVQCFDTLGEAVADCQLVIGASARDRTLDWMTLSPEQMAERALSTAAEGAQVAIVLGREASGLTNAELERCDLRLNIPSDPEFGSLNVAAAVQVAAYALRRQWLESQRELQPQRKSGGARKRDPLIPREDFEKMLGHIESAAVAVKFLNPRSPKQLMRRLRRLCGRVQWTRSEYQIMRGFCSAVIRHVHPGAPLDGPRDGLDDVHPVDKSAESARAEAYNARDIQDSQ